MKFKGIILALAACATLVSVSSCSKDFLDEHSYKFDVNGFYNTQEEITMGLNACYSEVSYMMTGCQRTYHSYMINGVGLDTFFQSSSNDCFSNWTLLDNTGNGYSRHWSDYMYQLSNRCNLVLDMMEERTGITYTSEEIKNSLKGEALFLRAFAYRALACFFGNTPIITKHSAEAKFDYEAASREEVWSQVYNDLTEAQKLLPKDARIEGAVVKATADAYLAEVCLALGKFSEAEAAASRVIDKTDGDYEIMTTRFGSRSSEATDRYGNSLAAPQGAYWDLFREGGNQRRSSGNKEVLWGIQYNWGTYANGGGGDSWFRTHFSYIECGWLPGFLQSPSTGTIALNKLESITDPAQKAKAVAFLAKHGYTDGETVYKYGVDLACFPKGVNTGSKQSTVAEAEKDGRWEAVIARDTIGGRCAGNGATGGNCVIPTRAMYNAMKFKDGSLHGFWDDPKDFRGSETMIQKDFYLPGGTKFSETKKMMYERQEAGLYTMTGADTTTWAPRLWKFSDDKHPNGNTTAYDCDWYMMRVAEVYLLRAEARLAQGNAAGAADDINVLRKRAGASEITNVDIDVILDERARELFGEEHRQVTLNRLSCNPNCGSYVTSKYPVQDATTSNTLYERTKKYGFGYENNSNTNGGVVREWNEEEQRFMPNIKPHHYQNPIPEEVIAANTGCVLPQNPGY